MLASVAGQFGFGERELWEMPRSRLQYWYDIVAELNREE